MVVWVWVMRDFWASGVEREKGRIAGKFSKISFFSPVSAFAGEKLHRAVQNGTVQFFFFLRKGKQNLGVIQNWVMTVAPLFTMLTEQRLCVVSL
jgi:hypothetical protein